MNLLALSHPATAKKPHTTQHRRDDYRDADADADVIRNNSALAVAFVAFVRHLFIYVFDSRRVKRTNEKHNANTINKYLGLSRYAVRKQQRKSNTLTFRQSYGYSYREIGTEQTQTGE